MTKTFDPSILKRLYKAAPDSAGEDNGQVSIIGGSSLFHGAPLLCLRVASRVVDMVFFASPEVSVGKVAEQAKARLFSFIWAPWGEVDEYIEKSDAVLIGPGFMRYRSEKTPEKRRNHEHDLVAKQSRDITERLLTKFPNKKWVIDAGSLQVMDASWIPSGAVLTPNDKEYAMLFGNLKTEEVAQKYHCIIIRKGPVARVCSGDECVDIKGGNAGLTKGGTGDVVAGLTVALLANNDAFLAAQAASFVAKAAADRLYQKVGPHFNADDLAEAIPQTLFDLSRD